MAHITKMINVNDVLAEESEGKKILTRSSRRWDDNIKVYIKSNRVESCEFDTSFSRDSQRRSLVNIIINNHVP